MTAEGFILDSIKREVIRVKIKDAEKLTGIGAQTIRYYESRGLLSVKRGENQYRDYDGDAIKALDNIRAMRELGIAVADIRLWRDGVVTVGELVEKRLKELEEGNRLSERQKAICESIIDGGAGGYMTGGEFTEQNASFDESADEAEPADDDILALGVDIGTTTVSAQLISLRDGRTYHTYGITHDAAITDESCPDACMMDAEKLLARATGLVRSAVGAYPGLRSIGFAGQMHGIVCLGRGGEALSPLYTWQNGFGLRKPDGGAYPTYLDEIKAVTGVDISSGYGFATLYCLKRMKLLPKNTVAVATIMDLAVMRLCGLKKPLLHTTNAASLGFFDLRSSSFDRKALEKLGFPEINAPDTTGDFAIAGYCGGIPVSVAIGDNQAGVFGSLRDEAQFLINVGTSSQVSIITDSPDFCGQGEPRPYVGGKFILSGAALCGGRAYSALADFFISAAKSMCGVRLSKNDAYEFMNREAALHSDDAPDGGRLTVDTRFCGTRRDISARGMIGNVGLGNFSPEQLICGTLRGIVGELYEMYLGMTKADAKSHTPVLSGNAIRRNEALRKLAGEIFDSEPLVPSHIEEAAYGAALFGAVSAGTIDEKSAQALIKYQ